MTDLPHFSLPFRFERLPDGHMQIAVTEEDSVDEVADCVELTVRTEQGERGTLPGFGRPATLLFTANWEAATAQLQDAVDQAEPRVDAVIRNDDIDPNDPGLLRIKALLQIGADEGNLE